MGNPIGSGERGHPPEGNALLFTVDAAGEDVGTPLWLASFATDLDLQLDTAQLHRKLEHRPIRLAERFLTFMALWNVRDRPKYEELVRRIREHWSYVLSQQDASTLMRLRYWGADKTWLGMVENAELAYAVTDVVLAYTFRMRVVPSTADEVAALREVEGRLPFGPSAPTAQDARNYGPGWYTVPELKGIARPRGV